MRFVKQISAFSRKANSQSSVARHVQPVPFLAPSKRDTPFGVSVLLYTILPTPTSVRLYRLCAALVFTLHPYHGAKLGSLSPFIEANKFSIILCHYRLTQIYRYAIIETTDTMIINIGYI